MKTSLKKVVFGTAALFLLMAMVTPAISASLVPILAIENNSEPSSGTMGQADTSFSATNAPDYTDPTGGEQESAPVAQVDPAQEKEASETTADPEEIPTEPPMEEEVPVDPEIVYPEDGKGNGKGKGRGQGFLLNNFKKMK